MNDPDSSTPAQRRAAQRRRLAEIFGDVLPDSTRDDQAEPAVDATSDPAAPGSGEGRRDAEIRRDVPPHHS